MQRDQVARTFYTRGRPERQAAKPVAQRNAFTDGCNDQYGWEVCWEMTANDGVNFRDATYDGHLIFSSAKIGQVEAWYPSWPGGYRDEIGFTASVPPFGDTQIKDFGDGFAVSQLFTEFTNWPNCICCYRYEEIVQFYDDGRVEFRFVSHGPGCDDLSVYRPFWRIDVDLDGPDNDSVWLWEGTSWGESLVEFETYPVVEDISPDGYKLATFDEELHYRWLMERTDPLRLDEGYLFLLQFNEKEGEGLITTGPGDTYIPPRQWIDGDKLSGENIVLWFVPLLNQKKGGPYWCLPDPEPAYSPCEAILRAEPAGDLRQPTVEELATVQPIPESATSPTPTTTPAATATPRPIDGAAVEEIIMNAGCGSCHQIGTLGEGHKVGPDLSDIGLTAAENRQGLSIEQYIRQAILDPNAILAEQCPNGPCLANIMPRDYETRLLPQQIDALVDFLMTQQQKVDSLATPEFAPGSDSQIASKAFPAPKNAKKPLQGSSINSTFVVQILLLSLVFLLSLLLFFKGSADDSPPT
jgi:cytochrome c551/c552